MNVIIIHGSCGDTKENWFPWLKKELEVLGCRVFVPKFPTPNGQSLTSWLAAFQPYEQYLDEETILVGHSVGPAFILSVLERTPKKITAAFLVAGFTNKIGNPYFDVLNESFMHKFDWDMIREHCCRFYIINADDDPYVPLEKGRELSEHLRSPLLVVHGGHLNDESGFREFPFVLQLIKSAL
jgi:uncharacterized protein